MSVKTTEQILSTAQAKQWVDERKIYRLPRLGEVMEYTPPGVAFAAVEYTLEPVEKGYLLKTYTQTGGTLEFPNTYGPEFDTHTSM